MKILIVKTSSMGDVIHTLPVINDIKANYPEATIDWLVETPFNQITSLHLGIRKTIPMSWRKWRKQLGKAASRQKIADLLQTLRDEHYDVVIDAQGLLKSAFFSKLSRGTQIHGYDWGSARESLSSVFYTHRHAVNTEMLAIERSRKLCALALNYTVDGKPVFGPLNNTNAKHDLLKNSYICLIHGASTDQKLLPNEHWLKVTAFAATNNHSIVLIWGSEQELARSKALEHDMKRMGVNTHIPPFLTISETAYLLAGAAASVGLDTGFTHLSGALGIPTVSIHRTHDPLKTGVQGDALCLGIGGVGVTPSSTEVIDALKTVLGLENER